jgi:hypothetical protein
LVRDGGSWLLCGPLGWVIDAMTRTRHQARVASVAGAPVVAVGDRGAGALSEAWPADLPALMTGLALHYRSRDDRGKRHGSMGPIDADYNNSNADQMNLRDFRYLLGPGFVNPVFVMIE